MAKSPGILLALLLATGLSSEARALSLTTDAGGNLLGASGINVGGSLFDVSFGNGTCAGLWDRCGDITPAFTFQTGADAMAAANALIAELFSAGDAFDTDPTLTNGCDDPDACYIITPYALDGDMETVFAYNALNLSGGGNDNVISAAIGTYTPTNPDATYALWSRTVSPVPLPGAIWLFAPALLGLMRLGRRKIHFRGQYT